MPDPIDRAAALVSYDICAMAEDCLLGAAINRIPVVVDGYISIAAALLATEIDPRVKFHVHIAFFTREPRI